MFQRPRDLSAAPLSTHSALSAQRSQQFRQCQGHNRRAQVHVTCELSLRSGEGGLAAPLSRSHALDVLVLVLVLVLLEEIWFIGRACACACACWQRSVLLCAGRQQTARGLVTMLLLLMPELYHSMLAAL